MKNKIYQGSSKVLYQSEEDFALIMAFTDEIRLEGGIKMNVPGKGVINNNISSFIMSKLDMVGIENHLIEKINMREQLVQLVDIFPIQISIATIACGRYVDEFGMEEGYVFDYPVIDFRVKNSDLKYPIINEHQIISFGWLTEQEIKQVKNHAIRAYDFLTGLFAGVEIRLVECRLEFGRVFNGEKFVTMIADEISPDNCRLWDMHSNEKFGFETLVDDNSNAIKSYHTIARRLNLQNLS
ncbi:Phosphoribosylaminoimidazole-succinocarboxamide synthase [Candidatus Trichorickettsia mobilis]|uniref:Phosphoribosylaminoimidazole-succinocarboxamide synthase n=1 Tax=Candidatus Trichorickettsia mobilis TaxID=1346319 RepID=A0ABZ0USJ8_9RICK|nr:phosphoribosylaminoimidazolesuccinocarboxamide synthase [Candidatus Trichorickettsia mobilis]WPY00491.1 Phosphoribosylaminoimidazole-succinocarboxamide synthase [Candidatus Trichorickettsia mobilis]